METEQPKVTMQVQMVQMVQIEAFSNNAKSTQEPNLKMIEFMAMITQKMGSNEEEDQKLEQRMSPRKK